MDEKIEKKYWNDIKRIERDYYSITSKFDLNFPKILNIDTEKKKFFESIENGIMYNPQFEFQKKEFDENKIKELKNLKIDSKEEDYYNIKLLYKKRVKSKLYEIKCHQHWGEQISTNYVLKYRGEPTLSLLNNAITFCENFQRQKVKTTTITSMQAGEKLNDEVERLTGQRIKVDYVLCMPSKVNIMPAEQKIQISSSEEFSQLDIERLKVHEIGVHYMRYFNAKKTGIKLLQKGTANYIETEEGLAVYFEELKGVLSNAQMHIYAGRVIGAYFALRKSFHEVFMILKNYGFSDVNAFNITARAKRNLSDTSVPGGFTKDYVYFSGYFKIKKYAENHDVRDLFIGKIKTEDVYLLKEFISKHKNEIMCDVSKIESIVENI